MGSRDEIVARAAIDLYTGRVARLSDGSRAVGYLYAFENTRSEVVARWWRPGAAQEVAIGWLIEWTDPARAQNGYTDESGDAGGPEDVLEVAADWRTKVHQRGDEQFVVEWLRADEAAVVAGRFGWQLRP